MVTFPPGSPEYQAATAPHNSSASQHPALVARPTTAEEVADVIKEATALGLTVLPQATGHGADGTIGDDALILDTSGLLELTIDAQVRTASAGPGLT